MNLIFLAAKGFPYIDIHYPDFEVDLKLF